MSYFSSRSLSCVSCSLLVFHRNSELLYTITITDCMFGLSFSAYDFTADKTVDAQVHAYCLCKIRADLELMYSVLCICLFRALFRPHGPQLTTYGYIQTSANLMGGSPVMWWGHKQDQFLYYYTGSTYMLTRIINRRFHAGTSDHPLPDVKMDCLCWFRRRVPRLVRSHRLWKHIC